MLVCTKTKKAVLDKKWTPIFFYKSEVDVCLCLVKASQQLSQFIENQWLHSTLFWLNWKWFGGQFHLMIAYPSLNNQIMVKIQTP